MPVIDAPACKFPECVYPSSYQIVVVLPKSEDRVLSQKVLLLPGWYICNHHAAKTPPHALIAADRWRSMIDQMRVEAGIYLPPYSEVRPALQPLDESAASL